MALVSAGTVFSHATRARPPGWVKILVALGALAACIWFFHAVSAPADGITSIINPLTVLLVTVLVVHSFHVPSRRDLLFTIGASAGLMAVGGALAIDLRFGLFVVAWASCCLWGLTEMWTSASGGGRLSTSGVVLAAGGVVDRRRRGLPRPPGARRVVPRLVHGAGRRRRLGRCPRGPGRRFRGGRAALPRRHARPVGFASAAISASPPASTRPCGEAWATPS